MSDEKKPVAVPAQVIGNMILGPIDYGLAASCRRALELGAPADKVIGLLLNHLASVVAMVDPPQAREMLVKDLVGSFGPMVRQHVEARNRTPGGVLLPNVGVPKGESNAA